MSALRDSTVADLTKVVLSYGHGSWGRLSQTIRISHLDFQIAPFAILERCFVHRLKSSLKFKLFPLAMKPVVTSWLCLERRGPMSLRDSITAILLRHIYPVKNMFRKHQNQVSFSFYPVSGIHPPKHSGSESVPWRWKGCLFTLCHQLHFGIILPNKLSTFRYSLGWQPGVCNGFRERQDTWPITSTGTFPNKSTLYLTVSK